MEILNTTFLFNRITLTWPFFVWWSYWIQNQHTFLISSELLLVEFGIKKRLLVNLILHVGVLPTPLHAAAVNGNKPLLQRLLHEGNAKFM